MPYSYTRQNAGAELGWDLARATRLGLAFDRESWDRKFREVKNTDENIWKAHRSTPGRSPGSRCASSYRVRRPLDRRLQHRGRRRTASSRRRPPPTCPTCASSTRRPASGTSYNVQAQFFATDAWSFFRRGDRRNDELRARACSACRRTTSPPTTPSSATRRATTSTSSSSASRHGPQDPAERRGSPGRPPRPTRSTTGRRTSTEVTDTWGVGFTEKLAKSWTLDVTANLSRSDGKADLLQPARRHAGPRESASTTTRTSSCSASWAGSTTRSQRRRRSASSTAGRTTRSTASSSRACRTTCPERCSSTPTTATTGAACWAST